MQQRHLQCEITLANDEKIFDRKLTKSQILTRKNGARNGRNFKPTSRKVNVWKTWEVGDDEMKARSVYITERWHLTVLSKQMLL